MLITIAAAITATQIAKICIAAGTAALTAAPAVAALKDEKNKRKKERE